MVVEFVRIAIVPVKLSVIARIIIDVTLAVLEPVAHRTLPRKPPYFYRSIAHAQWRTYTIGAESLPEMPPSLGGRT